MTTKHIRPYKFTVALFLALVTTLGFITDTANVLAIPDVQFYGSNDILFFDPDAANCSTGGGGGTLRGESTKEKIWNYLRDKGLSAEQAAGVMGNMDAESGFVITRRQGNNSQDLWNSNFTNAAWGLAQWDGGRRYSAPKGGILGKLREKQPDLIKYIAPEFGGPTGDEKIPAEDKDAILLFELNYLYDESVSRPVKERRYGVGKNEWETLKLTKTVDDATVYWHNNFEVSDDSPETVLNGRGAKSQTVFKEFSGNAGGGASTGEACATAGGATGNFTELLVKYAWPEYHPKGYVQRMPDYIEAVKKAKEQGRYIGDTCHGGGVDCGAWVTILTNNSGFDPAYNHNGKLKDGAGYTVVQKAWAEKNWQNLGNGSKINPADLKAGDVAHLEGHTFLFAGKGIKFKDANGKEREFGGGDSAFKGVASASQCGRAPMAGHESMTDSDVTWYRKK